jgi:hypothetical protein
MSYADLAFARHFEAMFGWGDGPIESHNRFGEAAQKAVAADDSDAMPQLEETVRLSPRGLLVVLWHLSKGWAALLAGRYEEAVEFAELAREANPEFPDIYAVLASAHGHLWSITASRAALDQLLHRMPGLTASDGRLARPFSRVADRERFLDGLRKAWLTLSQSDKVLERPGACGEDSPTDHARGRRRYAGRPNYNLAIDLNGENPRPHGSPNAPRLH